MDNIDDIISDNIINKERISRIFIENSIKSYVENEPYNRCMILCEAFAKLGYSSSCTIVLQWLRIGGTTDEQQFRYLKKKLEENDFKVEVKNSMGFTIEWS